MKKILTQTEIIDKYLLIFKKFANENNLEILSMSYNMGHSDRKEIEVKFKIVGE